MLIMFTFVINPESLNVGHGMVLSHEVHRNVSGIGFKDQAALVSSAEWATLLVFVVLKPQSVDTLVRDIVVIMSKVNVDEIDGNRLARRGQDMHRAAHAQLVVRWVVWRDDEAPFSSKC